MDITMELKQNIPNLNQLKEVLQQRGVTLSF